MRIHAVMLCASLLAFGAFTPAQAQTTQPKQPSPEEMQKVMDTTMGAMVPMLRKMTEAMIEAQLIFAERQSTAERIAVFKRNLYEALLKKGFTGEQAMQITIATTLPTASPSGK